MAKKLRLPPWSGPPVGAIVGAYVSLDANKYHFDWNILIGLGLGTIAGSILFFVDKNPESGDTHSRQSSTTARALAIIQLPFFFLPAVGLAFSIASLVMNWKASGWPKFISWTGVLLSSFVTVAFTAIVLIAKMPIE